VSLVSVKTDDTLGNVSTNVTADNNEQESAKCGSVLFTYQEKFATKKSVISILKKKKPLRVHLTCCACSRGAGQKRLGWVSPLHLFFNTDNIGFPLMNMTY